MTTTDTTTTTCEFEMTDPGPNAGCAEFDTDPGTITCAAPAEFVIVFGNVPPGPDGGDDTETVRFCAFHRDCVADDIDLVSVHRIGAPAPVATDPGRGRTFVYVIDGDPHVGTVDDIARAMAHAATGEAEVETTAWVPVTGTDGTILRPVNITASGSGYNDDDWARVTVHVDGAEGSYRIDGRA